MRILRKRDHPIADGLVGHLRFPEIRPSNQTATTTITTTTTTTTTTTAIEYVEDNRNEICYWIHKIALVSGYYGHTYSIQKPDGTPRSRLEPLEYDMNSSISIGSSSSSTTISTSYGPYKAAAKAAALCGIFASNPNSLEAWWN